MSLPVVNSVYIIKEKLLFLVLLFQIQNSFYCFFFLVKDAVIVKITKWKLNTVDRLKRLIEFRILCLERL